MTCCQNDVVTEQSARFLFKAEARGIPGHWMATMPVHRVTAKPETLPTRAKSWDQLKTEWLVRLIQHLDNEWIAAAVGDGAEVDRGTLEAILQYAVNIAPASSLGANRHVAVLFDTMLDIYNERGRPLLGIPLSHFQSSARGQLDQQGQVSQASDEGPEISITPDGFPFLHMGQQSMFLLTSVQGGADDWLLGSSSWGALVFSPSKGMAQLMSNILACPGHCWPLLQPPAPTTNIARQSAPQASVPSIAPCTPCYVEPGVSPQSLASGQDSRVPDLGTGKIMTPLH